MDLHILQFIVMHRRWSIDEVTLAMKEVGESSMARLVVIALVLAIAVRGRRWAWGVAVSLAACAAIVVADVAKAMIGRPRPPEHLAMVPLSGTAMPSSVSLLCAAMGVAVVVGWDRRGRPRRWGAVAAVAAVVGAFGFAVVYLGAHWPSDVLVGWAMGAIVGVVAVVVSVPLVAGARRLWPWLFDELERWARPGIGLEGARSDAVRDAEQT